MSAQLFTKKKGNSYSLMIEDQIKKKKKDKNARNNVVSFQDFDQLLTSALYQQNKHLEQHRNPDFFDVSRSTIRGNSQKVIEQPFAAPEYIMNSDNKENYGVEESNSLNLSEWLRSLPTPPQPIQFAGGFLEERGSLIESDDSFEFNEASKLIHKYFSSWRVHALKSFHLKGRMRMVDLWRSQFSLQKSIIRWSCFAKDHKWMKRMLKKFRYRSIHKIYIFWKLYASRARRSKTQVFEYWRRIIFCRKWLLKAHTERLKDAFDRIKRRCKFTQVLPFFKRRIFSCLYWHAKNMIHSRVNLVANKALPFFKLQRANSLFKQLFALHKRKKNSDLVSYYLLAKYFQLFRSRFEIISKGKHVGIIGRHFVKSLLKKRIDCLNMLRSNVGASIRKKFIDTRARIHISGGSRGKNSSYSTSYLGMINNSTTTHSEVIYRFAKWKNIFKAKSSMYLGASFFSQRRTTFYFSVWQRKTDCSYSNKAAQAHFHERITQRYFHSWLVSYARKQSESFGRAFYARKWKSCVFRVFRVSALRKNMFRDDFMKCIFHFERSKMKKALATWIFYFRSKLKVIKYRNVSRFIKLFKALNKLRSQKGKLTDLINLRRSDLRYQFTATKMAFNKLFKFMIKRAMRRRFFFVFRAMFPIPACSAARRVFNAWKCVYVPWSLRTKNSLRMLSKTKKLAVMRKCIRSWEKLFDEKVKLQLTKTRVMKQFKAILSRVKLSWDLQRHRVVSSKVTVPSHFFDSDSYRMSKIYSKAITRRKSLYFFLKNALTDSKKFSLPGAFYRVCFLKRVFVAWHRKIIDIRNYNYEHRAQIRKIGRIIRRSIYMRCSIKDKLRKSIVRRLFLVWKEKRSRLRTHIDNILSRNRLIRGFKAWNFAHSQIYLSKNLFSSPQAKRMSNNNGTGLKSTSNDNERYNCNYSNILDNPYSSKIGPETMSQRHLYQDKFLGYKAISIGKEIRSKSEFNSTIRITKGKVNRDVMASTVFRTTPLFRGISSSDKSLGSPSVIASPNKSDLCYMYHNSSETLLLSPNVTPAKLPWKSLHS